MNPFPIHCAAASGGSSPAAAIHRILLVILVLALGVSFSSGELHAQQRDSLGYIVQMKSGDSFRGVLLGYTDSAVIILTEFDSVVVPKELISRFIPVSEIHPPYHFLMPSASPNGPGGFIGNYELGFLYGGFGIGPDITVTAGMTMIPGISLSSQFFHVGVKYTLLSLTDQRRRRYDAAVGLTGSWLTSAHGYGHGYIVGSIPLWGGRISGMFHFRFSGPTNAEVAVQAFNYDTTRFSFSYQGKKGGGIGIDIPCFGRDDLFWVGEVWIANTRNSDNGGALFFGLRIMNEHLSALFGGGTVGGFILPITHVAWRF